MGISVNSLVVPVALFSTPRNIRHVEYLQDQ
jgi:hypothetical protein